MNSVNSTERVFHFFSLLLLLSCYQNEFHLLSDEENIPPYYRAKHRPALTVDPITRTIVSSTVSQLRYVELTVVQVGFGLNGDALIQEETVNVLQHFANDTGAEYATIFFSKKIKCLYIWLKK